MPVDPDFRRPALVDRIVRGAAERDLVRLHGAIVATLELYGRDDALRGVFVPALRRLRREHGRGLRNRGCGRDLRTSCGRTGPTSRRRRSSGAASGSVPRRMRVDLLAREL